MLLLACDPGSIRCGFALFDDRTYRQSWCFVQHARVSFQQRLLRLGRQLISIASTLQAQWFFAIEDPPFYPGSKKTGLLLSEVVGVLKYAALAGGAKTVVVVSPLAAKQAATGNRRAGKDLVQAEMAALIGRDLSEDEADAVAVGLAALRGRTT